MFGPINEMVGRVISQVVFKIDRSQVFDPAGRLSAAVLVGLISPVCAIFTTRIAELSKSIHLVKRNPRLYGGSYSSKGRTGHDSYFPERGAKSPTPHSPRSSLNNPQVGDVGYSFHMWTLTIIGLYLGTEAAKLSRRLEEMPRRQVTFPSSIGIS